MGGQLAWALAHHASENKKLLVLWQNLLVADLQMALLFIVIEVKFNVLVHAAFLERQHI